MYSEKKSMAQSCYPFVVLMGREMLPKWDKYWTSGNLLLVIACVLDPRCKLGAIEYYLGQLYPTECEGLVTNLKNCLGSLYKEYLEEHSKSNQAQGSTTVRSTSRGTSSSVSNSKAGLKDYMKGKKSTAPKMTDLDLYLADDPDDASLDEDFDILGWWKVNAPKYPVLARLAQDVLVVPISTVAPESAFSGGGRTLSPVRSSLSDESIEVLMCAQDWLCASVIEKGCQAGDQVWCPDEEAG